jgi:hypothetical protein
MSDAEFAEAILDRCAKLLYAEMRPQVEARAALRSRQPTARRQAARPADGNVVSLTAHRLRKAAA